MAKKRKHRRRSAKGKAKAYKKVDRHATRLHTAEVESGRLSLTKKR